MDSQKIRVYVHGEGTIQDTVGSHIATSNLGVPPDHILLEDVGVLLVDLRLTAKAMLPGQCHTIVCVTKSARHRQGMPFRPASSPEKWAACLSKFVVLFATRDMAPEGSQSCPSRFQTASPVK
jgi:hypothetical protein